MNPKPKHNPRLQPLALGLFILGTGVASAATGSGITAAGLDTRDYTLAVVSARGTPVPAVGDHAYVWQSAVTCSVDSAVSEGGTSYTCTGWAGTGAIPATGTTNNTGVIVLTSASSSIIWNWVPSTLAFDAQSGTAPNPVSKQVTPGLTYGALASTTRTGYTFAGWFTAAIGGTEVTDVTTVTATADHTLYAHWTANTTATGSAAADLDTRDYTLAVASARGTPVPADGDHAYAWQSAVTCSVDSAVSEGGTSYTCTGWAGTGAIPATGATNNTGAITLTSVASSLAWQWQAQSSTRTVTLHPGAHGSIAGANAGSNYVVTVTNGAAFPAVAVNAAAGWTFTGWSPPAPATVTSDFEATAVVVDTTPPTIACPGTVTVSTDAGQSYASSVALGTPVTSDNSGSATATNNAPTQFPIGTNVVTWTAVDSSGNTNTCTQQVIVQDTQAPPAVAVSPASQDFGTMQVGTTAERTFYVTNSGGGTLSGSAMVPTPFSIVSGGTYSLAANASQAVVMR